MKSLGKKPEGSRLDRIKASPLWTGERFRNVHPIIPGLRDPNAAMPTMGDFMCGGERRVPRGPLPSMNPLEAWVKPPAHPHSTFRGADCTSVTQPCGPRSSSVHKIILCSSAAIPD